MLPEVLRRYKNIIVMDDVNVDLSNFDDSLSECSGAFGSSQIVTEPTNKLATCLLDITYSKNIQTYFIKRQNFNETIFLGNSISTDLKDILYPWHR